MIFDSISNKENYKEEKEIYQTLNFLEKLKKWDDVESNAIIQKDWISANPVSFLSKDESECMYEAHRKHIDVHYIMEGIEKIATADVKNLQEKVPFDKDKDIGFYEGCESGSYLLKTGDFMVCFPSDAHKVGMMNIDPVLLEDKSTHRVFLFADLMPAGIGSSNASVGSGFKEINGKKYLKLHWKDDSSSDYNYSIRENGIIYDDTTNASTEYSVDGEYNLYKNGEALTCKQYDYNFEGTSLLETPTDTDVNMNVFYKDSMFKVFPTNYLAMKYSDDEGDNWSDLNIVSTFKPEESKFLVLGPGIGKQITTGENAGRLIVPLYSKSSAELGFMYSDDHGNSWNYVEADHNTGGATAEAQIVEMPDGSLKTYLRTGSGYIAEVTSIDGGETWSDRVPLTEIATTSYGTQLSVINYSQPIDGKPAIILSAPNATNGRKNGKIWIGLINETGQSGVNKYSVEWKYCYSVDTPQMGYSYSCLTELPDGKVGLLYEKYDSWSRNELHLKNILKYEKFTIDELKVQP